MGSKSFPSWHRAQPGGRRHRSPPRFRPKIYSIEFQQNLSIVSFIALFTAISAFPSGLSFPSTPVLTSLPTLSAVSTFIALCSAAPSSSVSPISINFLNRIPINNRGIKRQTTNYRSSRSEALYDFDFEDEGDGVGDDGADGDDSDYDCPELIMDDESILWGSNHRGGARCHSKRRNTPLSALSSTLSLGRWGQQSSKKRTTSNNHPKKSNQNPKQSHKLQQQIQSAIQLQQKQHMQKRRQFRKLFREKQREFQTAMYLLNSRQNYDFPPPPYQQWVPPSPSGPQPGQTTLTGKIFLINLAMFGVQTAFPALTSWGAKRSDLLLQGRELHRLLTPVFLHGGLGHLLANGYSLKSMGVNVEQAFGPSRFIATYLISGIMGNVVSAIQSPNPAVGASGAIFGLVGAYYTFLSRNSQLFGYVGQSQKNALIETIGFNLLLGMTNPIIDNWGHVGGFLGGVGMAYLIGPKLFVARVPVLGEGSGDENGVGLGKILGGGKVIIDRPTLVFRTPVFLEEGFYWVNDNLRLLGKRVKRSAKSLFRGGGGDREFFLGQDINIFNTGDGSGSSLDKATIPLDGNIYVTPTDGLRQNVSDLDPMEIRRRERGRSVPRPGKSIRPRYGHLYR